MKLFLYRMCECEVRETIQFGFQLWHVPKRPRTAGKVMSLIASFKTRHAAIAYLAKEFVIPIQHAPGDIK